MSECLQSHVSGDVDVDVDVDIELAPHARSPETSYNILHPYVRWDDSIHPNKTKSWTHNTPR